jgi:CheY-like chemotaxis protein
MTGDGASAAIAQLQQHTFNLVVCDMMMRDIDGADVYEACRASAANRSARFAILTEGKGDQASPGVGQP